MEPVPHLTGSDDEAWTQRRKQGVEKEERGKPKRTITKRVRKKSPKHKNNNMKKPTD